MGILDQIFHESGENLLQDNEVKEIKKTYLMLKDTPVLEIEEYRCKILNYNLLHRPLIHLSQT